MKVKVTVSLKNGVLDPQAKAIKHALVSNGFDSIKAVKLAKEMILDIDENDKNMAVSIATKACDELLANVVIEDYQIELA